MACILIVSKLSVTYNYLRNANSTLMNVHRVSQNVKSKVHLVIIENLTGSFDFFACHLYNDMYQCERVWRFP